MYTLDEVMKRLDATRSEVHEFIQQGRLPRGVCTYHRRQPRWSESEVDALAEQLADEDADQQVDDALKAAEDAREREQVLADSFRPADVLRAGAQHMEDRAATYDKPEGERSMGATVGAFNAITGHQVTEEQGWMFMALLKMVRSQQGQFKLDNYEDGAAYFALAAESGAKSRTSGE